MKTNKIKLFFFNFFEGLFYKIFNSIIEKIVNEKLAKHFNSRVGLLETEIESIKDKLTPKILQAPEDLSLITSVDSRFNIRIEKCPNNKDTLKFHTSKTLYTEGHPFYSFDFPSNWSPFSLTTDVENIRDMVYAINLCVSVRITPFSVSITKSAVLKWSNIIPEIADLLFNYLERKYPQV